MIFSTEQLRTMGAAAELERARKRERPVSAPLAPLPAQLDLDGGAHELAPQTRQERLFAPAPEQLAGQTFLTDDDLDHAARNEGNTR